MIGFVRDRDGYAQPNPVVLPVQVAWLWKEVKVDLDNIRATAASYDRGMETEIF